MPPTPGKSIETRGDVRFNITLAMDGHRNNTSDSDARMDLHFVRTLRTGLKEVLPSGAELSDASVATFFENDAESIIAKAEPIIAKDGRRAWIVRD